MDSLLSLDARNGGIQSGLNAQFQTPPQAEEIILRTLVNSEKNPHATVEFSFGDLYKALSVTGRKIIDRLNELLKEDLPEGIQSLKPKDVTPEATAERIVRGATAFFGVFAKQNPELEGEELLNAFMGEIRKGIDTGYNDAFSTLEDLGAFEFSGVKDGVEETKSLIEEKLIAFESQMRKQLGLDPIDVESRAEDLTQQSLLTLAGGRALEVTA